MRKNAIIRKLPNGKYRLYSRKKDESGHRRNLGTYDSLKAAKKRERQVQFFKQHADDACIDSKTKLLLSTSNMAQLLDMLGFNDEAKSLYDKLVVIDECLDATSDIQLNTGNQSYIGGGDGISGAYTSLSMPHAASNSIYTLIKLADNLDNNNNKSFADEIDSIIKGLYLYYNQLGKKYKKPRAKKVDDIDTMVGANGHVGVTVTDNQNSGAYQGFGESWFYGGYNQEDQYGPYR